MSVVGHPPRPQAQSPYRIAFNQETAPYRVLDEATYDILACVEWEGFDVVRLAKAITVVVDQDDADSVDIEVYDVTNSLLVVEATGITTTGIEIIDLGALSNLSAGPAVWRIRGLRTGSGNKSGHLYSLAVKF